MTRWRFGHVEVFAVIGAMSFAAARVLPLLGLGYRCPTRALFGVPCATCGMTRAFVRLAHGDVAGALAASPAGAMLAAGAWGLAAAALLRPIAGFEWPRASPGTARGLAIAALAALLANWGYLLATGARA